MLLRVADNVKFDPAEAARPFCPVLPAPAAFDERPGIQDNEHLTVFFKSNNLHNERHDDRHI
jgi:hypothetical protein